jgi:hypothetical protein
MFISISRGGAASRVDEIKAEVARVHEFLRTMPGFRWAMLLDSLEAPGVLTAVSMWLSPQQASAQEGVSLGEGEATRGFDVTTARGAMTPATHLAVVEWQIPDADAARFTTRWNAVYHHIEERIGSRLLKDLQAQGMYAGLHAVTDETNLDLGLLSAPITDADGFSLTPGSVRRYRVLGVTEAP